MSTKIDFAQFIADENNLQAPWREWYMALESAIIDNPRVTLKDKLHIAFAGGFHAGVKQERAAFDKAEREDLECEKKLERKDGE